MIIIVVKTDLFRANDVH